MSGAQTSLIVHWVVIDLARGQLPAGSVTEQCLSPQLVPKLILCQT